MDTSWVFIALLVTYSLHQTFQRRFDELSSGTALVLAVVFGLLFFGSVLAHEMAHAVTARRRGIEVRGITLFLFGGATHAKVDSRRPQDELVISVLGPLTSLALGGLFFLASSSLGGPGEPVAGGFRYLGGVNILLAVFNMLPGFPLDGGRVLRALIWRVTGNFSRATRIASVAGQVVGYLLVAWGLVMLAMGLIESAIWISAIGLFLAQAARASFDDRQPHAVAQEPESEHPDSPPPRPA